MPEGAWHCYRNFSDQKAGILYFITPKVWSESISPVVILSGEETKFYKGPNNDTFPDMCGKVQGISRQGCTDDIGAWPVDPREAGETGVVHAVRDFEKLNGVHGIKHPTLIRSTTSNSYGRFGEFILPASDYGPRYSDPDTREGDAALYCVKGLIVIDLVDLKESFILKPEDAFFTSPGVRYRLVNFENHPVEMVFAITKLQLAGRVVSEPFAASLPVRQRSKG